MGVFTGNIKKVNPMLKILKPLLLVFYLTCLATYLFTENGSVLSTFAILMLIIPISLHILEYLFLVIILKKIEVDSHIKHLLLTSVFRLFHLGPKLSQQKN